MKNETNKINRKAQSIRQAAIQEQVKGFIKSNFHDLGMKPTPGDVHMAKRRAEGLYQAPVAGMNIPSGLGVNLLHKNSLALSGMGYKATNTNKRNSTLFVPKKVLRNINGYNSEDLNNEQGRFSHIFKDFSIADIEEDNNRAVSKNPFNIRIGTTLNKSRQSVQRQLDGFRNINDKQMSWAWDLETDGSETVFGRSVNREITEIGLTVTHGKLGDANAQVSKFGTIIGFNQEKHDKAMKLIEKMEEVGYDNLPDNEKASIERYALHGHHKTVIDMAHPDTAKGLYNFTSFAERKDVNGKYTASMAREGVKKLRAVGRAQESMGKVSYKGHDMLPFEKEIFSQLDYLIDNEVTAITTNGLNFDNHVLREQLMRGITSEGSREYARQKYTGEGGMIKHQVDMLAYSRTTQQRDHYGFVNDSLRKAANGDEAKFKELRAEYDRRIKKKDVGILTQEGQMILHELVTGYKQQDAHRATEDAHGVSKMVYAHDLNYYEEQLSFAKKDKERTLESGKRQVLVADKAINLKGNNLVSFRHDGLSGAMHTSAGVNITENGLRDSTYRDPNIKAKVAYEFVGAGSLPEDSKVSQAIKEMYKDMDQGEMSLAILRPLGQSPEDTMRDTIYIYGPKEQLELSIDQSMTFAGHLDENGSLDTSAMSPTDRKKFQRVKINGDKVEKVNKSVADIILEESREAQLDGAGRKDREANMKHDILAGKMSEDVNKYIREQREAGREVTLEEAQQEILKRTKAVYDKLSRGEELTAADKELSAFKYFGYSFKDEDNLMYESTAKNNVGRLGIVDKQSEIKKMAQEEVLKTVGLTEEEFLAPAKDQGVRQKKQLASMLYKRAVDNLQETAIKKAETQGNLRNPEKTVGAVLSQVVSKDEFEKTFAVDITGFRGVNPIDPEMANVKFRLDDTGDYFGRISSVLSQSKRASGKVAKETKHAETKVRTLIDFQNFLESTHGAVVSDDARITENMTVAQASAMLKKNLIETREVQPTAFAYMPKKYSVGIDIPKNAELTREEAMHAIQTAMPGNYTTRGNTFAQRVLDHSVSPLTPDGRGLMVVDQFNNGSINKYVPTGDMREVGRAVEEREMHKRKNLGGMVNDVIGMIEAHGGEAELNEETGDLMARFEDGIEHKIHLPKQRMTDGIAYYEVGPNGSRITNQIGLHNVNGQAMVTDTYHAEYLKMGGVKGLARRLQREENPGDYAETINRFISQVNKAASEKGINTYRMTVQDAKRSHTGTMRDLPALMPLLEGTEFEQGLRAVKDPEVKISEIEGQAQADTILYRLIHPEEGFEKETFEDLSEDELKVIGKRGKEILHAFSEKVGGDAFAIDFLTNKDIQFVNKQYESGTFKIDNIDYATGIDSMGPEKRHIVDVRDAARQFNAGKAKDVINDAMYFNDGKKVEGLRVGALVESKAREAAGYGANIGEQYTTSVTTTNLSINDEDLNHLTRTWAQDESLPDPIRQKLMALSTNDGAGYMHSLVADTGIADTAYEQKIDPRKLTGEALHTKYSAILPSYENGRSEFKINAGDEKVFVKKGGTGLYQQIGSRQEEIIAKEDSYMSYRYQKGDKTLGHAEVQKILEENGIRQRIEGKTTEEISDVVQDIFEKNGIQTRIVLERAEHSVNVKTLVNEEKNMLMATTMGLGEVDPKVKGFLEESGRGHLVGKVLTKDAIENVTDEIYKNNEHENPIFKKYFNDINEFEKSVHQERHAVSRFIDEKAREAGFISGENEILGAITNTSKAGKKHSELSESILNVVGELHRRGYSQEDVMDIMSPAVKLELSKGNASRIGRYTYAEDVGPINVDELTKIKENYIDPLGDKKVAYLDGKRYIDEKSHVLSGIQEVEIGGKKINVAAEHVQLSATQNFDRLRLNDDAHFTVKERDIVNLTGQKFDEKAAERLVNAAKEAEANGDSSVMGLVNKVFGSRLETAKDSPEALNQGISDAIMSKYGSGAGQVLHTEFSHTTADLEAGLAELEGKNISRSEAMAAIETLKQSGSNHITTEGVEKFLTGRSHVVAHQFNSGTSGLKLEDMEKKGFSVVKLSDLDTAADVFSDTENKAVNRNLVVDLHDEKFGGKLYGDDPSKRFLAIPYTAPGIEIEEGVKAQGEIMKGLDRLKGAGEVLADTTSTIEHDAKVPKEIRDAHANALKRAENALGDLSTNLEKNLGKSGAFARSTDIMLGSSYGGTAYSNMVAKSEGLFDENAVKRELESFKFEGESLTAHANNPIGFNVLSTKARDEMYASSLDEIGKVTGISTEELKGSLYGELQENGSLGISRRSPTNSETSVSATKVYFSDTVKGDAVYTEKQYHGSKQGDYDSDKIDGALIKQKAILNMNGQTHHVEVDEAMFNTLSKMKDKGIDISWADDGKAIQNAKQGILYNALVVEPQNQTGNQAFADRYDFSKIKEYTFDGSTVLDNKNYSVEESQKYAKQYDSLVSNYKEHAGIEDSAWQGMSHQEQNVALMSHAQNHHGNQAEDYIESVKFNSRKVFREAKIDAESLKRSAGQLDYILYNGFARPLTDGNHLTSNDNVVINSFRQVLQQGALTPKNEGAGHANGGNVERLQTAIHGLMYSMTTRSSKKREEAIEQFKEIVTPMAMSQSGKFEIGQAANVLGTTDPEEQVHRMIDQIADITRRTNLDKDTLKNYKIGISRSGVKSTEQVTMTAGGSGLVNSQLSRINQFEENMGGEGVVKSTSAVALRDNPARINRGKAFSDTMSSAMTKRVEDAKTMTETKAANSLSDAAPVAEEVAQETVHQAKQVSSEALDNSKLERASMQRVKAITSHAKGFKAAGSVIAGLAIAGYAGGLRHHPQDASMQAQGAAEGHEVLAPKDEHKPMLQDAQNVFRSRDNTSYIIKMSGSSSHGKAATAGVMSGALKTSVPAQNSTVSLTVNNQNEKQLKRYQLQNEIQRTMSY